MEWIQISPNKLKVMLTAEDARYYALDCEHADRTSTLTREAFREILSDLRMRVGFDATEDKAYIQMYPSKEGGCELFITKTGLLLLEEEDCSKAFPAPRTRRSKMTEKAIRFEKIEPMLSLCRRLRTDAKLRHSEAFRDDTGAWWLLLRREGALSFAAEYGELREIGAARLYLGEHSQTICKNRAVETLSAL